MRELSEVLDDLETLLKNNLVGAALGDRGVNTSLAMVAVSGLRSYLLGSKLAAADDFDLVSEEIRTRRVSPIEA